MEIHAKELDAKTLNSYHPIPPVIDQIVKGQAAHRSGMKSGDVVVGSRRHDGHAVKKKGESPKRQQIAIPFGDVVVNLGEDRLNRFLRLKMMLAVDEAENKEITELFNRRGFPTEVRNGRRVGFFHGTGHGLGLEIHEYPRLQKVTLKAGQCLTVEPGLYYPGIGGARIEDVVVVEKDGCRILSKFPKKLEI